MNNTLKEKVLEDALILLFYELERRKKIGKLNTKMQYVHETDHTFKNKVSQKPIVLKLLKQTY